MTNLAEQKCEPCEGGVPPMTGPLARKHLREVHGDWKISEDEKKISRKFKFADFKQAMKFVRQVGKIAEEQGHHPDIKLGWGYAEVCLTTHAIDGLSINDFIIAARVDETSY